jgi:hypothetical protein
MLAGDFRYAPTTGGITITAYTGNATDVQIPEVIDGQKVRSIADTAFAQKPVTQVSIPASVTHVGTFSECAALKSLTVSLTNTTYASFDGIVYDKSFNTLKLCPQGKRTTALLASTTQRIAAGSFQSCESLTSVIIPATVTRIDAGAFSHCESLKSYFFKGDATSFKSSSLSGAAVGATAYYLRSQSGWGTTFLGMPTATTPLKPSVVAGTAGPNLASLSWRSPSADGGSSVTDYLVEYSTNNGSKWTPFGDGVSPATRTAVTSLANTPHIFRIGAVNKAGFSGWSTASFPVTPQRAPAVVPGIPATLTATPGNGNIKLAWSTPSPSDSAPPPTDYSIIYSSDNWSTWRTWSHPASPSTTATIPGLRNGVIYSFRVSAINDRGTGAAASVTATATDPAATMKVNVLSGTAMPADVQIAYSIQDYNGYRQSHFLNADMANIRSSEIARWSVPDVNSIDSPLTITITAKNLWRGLTRTQSFVLPVKGTYSYSIRFVNNVYDPVYLTPVIIACH